jgi:hypothetical protein
VADQRLEVERAATGQPRREDHAGGELVAEHERMAENRIADGPSEYQ